MINSQGQSNRRFSQFRWVGRGWKRGVYSHSLTHVIQGPHQPFLSSRLDLLQGISNFYSKHHWLWTLVWERYSPLSLTLNLEIDLSINRYSTGCHLLVHDDVIGSRRVSFILYLPDLHEQEWKDVEGGRLELYPVKEKGFERDWLIDSIPHDEPCSTLKPLWNSFTFFTVVPGHSFHSVEEVVGERDRFSISGWYLVLAYTPP